MNLVAVPAFTDNYIWILHDGQAALVVDPGEAAPVQRALDERSLKLRAIVVTHHHGDHVGGIEELLPRLRRDGGGPIFGPAGESIPHRTHALRGGDGVDLLGTRFEVIDVPGHTAGHIAYFGQPTGQAPLLLCGDTLFGGGCGRLFEGTPAQMHASLDALAALPSATRVCCAHEYTLSNLRFALAADPDNAELLDRIHHCEALRAAGQPTLPSTLAQELHTNPFLRCREPAVVASARRHGAASDSAVDVFAALRAWKNNFK
ncbi:hydroxyacylglutathione hydrolase [Rivibacter subsaxonicus]|uniref:Hydroxyacylglutathione hydrolase n=1 Tax=Rivibacter subsaxonicus TaxID=457575 RepID=A0A4Q7VN81_9BURK|nr:hydroxyacylglutathione hydrolase [Rivibacter subsaxonicus]RZT97816.1 hydroxyacylglutathione hydrolase [Rivibacter subsaxonicus]